MNKSTLLEIFGCNVKKLRKSLKLSQIELAEKLDLTRSSVAQVETGKIFVTAETLANLCNTFDCKPEELFKK